NLGREAVRPSVLGEPALDRDRAGHAVIWTVERHEEPVARVLDLLAPVLVEERTERLVVPPEDVLPAVFPDRLEEIRGLHDVGEHERADGALGCRARGLQRGELLVATSDIERRSE